MCSFRLLPHFLVLLLLGIIFISAADIHPNLKPRDNCVICRVTSFLSSADENIDLAIIIPDTIPDTIPDGMIGVAFFPVAGSVSANTSSFLKTRAPPLS